MPVAAAGALIAIARGGWRSALRPERALAVALVLAGIGMLAPIHHAHSKLLFDWLFAHRHGLPFILLMLPAAAALSALPSRAWRGVVLTFALLGAGLGVADIHGSVRLSPISDWDRALAAWLDEQEEPPIVVTTAPGALALVSDRGRFHWMACDESPATLGTLLDAAGADFVAVYPWEENCAFLAGARRTLAPVKVFGGGKIVVLGKRHGSGASIR